jgi:hypothetical protein
MILFEKIESVESCNLYVVAFDTFSHEKTGIQLTRDSLSNGVSCTGAKGVAGTVENPISTHPVDPPKVLLLMRRK